jgi:hypothetical protein
MAAKLYAEAEAYYNEIGINRPLTMQEEDIVTLIEAKQAETTKETIEKLLKFGAQRQHEF